MRDDEALDKIARNTSFIAGVLKFLIAAVVLFFVGVLVIGIITYLTAG